MIRFVLALVLGITSSPALAQDTDAPIRLGPGEKPPAPAPAPADEESSRTDKAFEAGGFWIPVQSMWFPRHENQIGPGFDLDRPDAVSGRGWGARAAVAWVPRAGAGGAAFIKSVGGLYTQTEHREREAVGYIRTHAAYLEFRGVVFAADLPVSPIAGASVGVGWAQVHFSRGYADRGGLAFEASVFTGVRVAGRFQVEAGADLYAWGYPSYTLAQGGGLFLGGSLTF